MSNEKVSQLPTVANATLADVIYAIQGGVSVQETLQQVLNITSQNVIQSFSGNPNGNVAGTVYNLCWNTSSNIMYVCTTSGSTSTAVWTPIALPAGTITPASGGTGVVNPTAHGIAVAEGASNFNFLTLANGQLLIGSTGADPVAATLTAGPGVSIANGPGTITISGTASGIGWTDVTGSSQAMVADSGYTANSAGLVTFTLPTTATYGTGLAVVGKGAGGWKINVGTGQNIQVGSVSTTVSTGSVASTNQFDVVNLVCTTANNTWTVISMQGNLTII